MAAFRHPSRRDVRDLSTARGDQRLSSEQWNCAQKLDSSSSGTVTGCSVCRSLHKLATAPVEANMHLKLGSNKDLAIGNCQTHISLFASFGQEFWDKRPTSEVTAWKDKGDLGLVTVSESAEIFNMFQLYRVGQLYNNYRILDIEWIRSNLLKQWKAVCERSHRRSDQTGCLISPAMQYLQPSKPQYFVDTWLRCLSPAPSIVKYTTLSYVWGQSKFFTTTKENISTLEKPGSLLDPKVLELLPNTIKDAINLVEYLGERYLWVDALCIVQDSYECKYDQINNMASIFGNSHLTIIAADGDDAEYGLRGLRGISKPRVVDQKLHWLTSRLQFIRRPILDPYDTQSRWSNRGWTFQEDIFSTRRLKFQRQMVQWECDGDHWAEDWEEVNDKLAKRRNLGYLSAIFGLSYPSLSGYRELVEQYGKRELSYPEDSLPAFSGITTALAPVFRGGFVSGLPVMFFEAALLWQPRSTSRRRVAATHPGKSVCLPSWSWVGWEGEIDTRFWDAGQCYIKKSNHPGVRGSTSSHRIVPMLQWSVSEELESTEKQLHSTWRQYLNCHWDTDQTLPQKWMRYQWRHSDIADRQFQPPFAYKETLNYFKHENVPGIEFWYPIIIGQDDHPAISPMTRYLSCQTQRIWLFRGITLTSPENFKPHRCLLLNERNGRLAGILRLHSEEDKSSFTDVNNSIELIALCKGIAIPNIEGTKSKWDANFEELGINEELKAKDLYKFYHVMWIEWDSGIAYRKAIGRVFEDVWERQDLNLVDIIIG